MSPGCYAVSPRRVAPDTGRVLARRGVNRARLSLACRTVLDNDDGQIGRLINSGRSAAPVSNERAAVTSVVPAVPTNGATRIDLELHEP